MKLILSHVHLAPFLGEAQMPMHLSDPEILGISMATFQDLLKKSGGGSEPEPIRPDGRPSARSTF
jgi:hypothetical protein